MDRRAFVAGSAVRGPRVRDRISQLAGRLLCQAARLGTSASSRATAVAERLSKSTATRRATMVVSRFSRLVEPVRATPVARRLSQLLTSPRGEVVAHRLSKLLLVFALYFVGGRIGLSAPFTSGNVSPVWPPAGIALAAVLLIGSHVWPAIAAGAFLVNFLSPIPHSAALGIAAGNTGGALLGAWLLRRLGWFQPSLGRLQDVLALVVVGGLGGTALSATVGTAVLSLTHVDAWSSAGLAWLMWWLGDAMGVLIVAPLVLTTPALLETLDDRRSLELAGLLFGAFVCSAVVFGGRPNAGHGHEVVSLALLAFVLWGAIRFDAAGAAAVTGAITAIAAWDTAHGLGLFVYGTSVQNATLLQSFLSVIAVSGLSVAALIAERTRLVWEKAEREAMRQGEERYREISETANEGVWMLDSQLLTCFVNRRMAQMLGYSVQEMLGRPATAFMYKEDAAAKKEELERRRQGVSEQVENRYRRKDGSELWARVSSSGSFDGEGRFAGALAMVSDITEHKRHEMEGKRSRDAILLLSRAVEQTTDSVIVTDKNGVIEYVNPAFETTTGYRVEEAVGRTPAILKSGCQDYDFYRDLWDRLLQGQPFRGAVVNRKKNGEFYWAEQTITPVKDDDGAITHFVSVLQDVTERRRKQEQEVQLQVAREVQQQFYRPPLDVPGLQMAAASLTMRETGGDYFDFIAAGDGSVYIAVGDASGNGLGSALVMALTRAYVRSFASLDLEVGEILTRVNRLLALDLDDNRFVTLLLAHLDRRTRALSYASAGHVPGFIFGPGGRLQSLSSTGPPLGLFADATFPACDVQLAMDDAVVLVTDGVTESGVENGEEFGIGGLVGYVSSHNDEMAANIAHGICRAARAFTRSESQVDDMTALVAKVLTSPSAACNEDDRDLAAGQPVRRR